MKKYTGYAARAVAHLLNPNRNKYGFELLGLDFMLDEDMKLYLIEVNTNPSLTVCSPVTGRVISQLIENVLK